MTVNIQKIKARLAALRAKANDSGATEAEAVEAMKAAMKLAEKYGVSLDDLATDDVEVVKRDFASNGDKAYLHEVDSMLATSLAKFCDCQVWRQGGIVSFAGLESDIELAVFLRERLKATMDFEYEIYKEFVHEGRITRGIRASFMAGFAERIKARMSAFKSDAAKFDKSSTALVVRKNELVRAFVHKTVGHLTAGRKSGYVVRDNRAYASGQYSGSQADIGRGVRQGNAGLIGR